MTHDPPFARQLARNIRQALAASDDLSCAEAQAQIPDLVAAERAGLDPDRDPAYARLLAHLDHCAACMDHYVALADDMEALVGEEEQLPQLQPPAPTFFPPVQQRPHAALWVLDALRRHFQLRLTLPQLGPSVPVLSGTQTLFTETLAQIGGAPFVAVSLQVRGSTGDLQVALREAGQTGRWEVEVALGGTRVAQAHTDARGIATFADLPLQGLQDISIRCRPSPSE